MDKTAQVITMIHYIGYGVALVFAVYAVMAAMRASK